MYVVDMKWMTATDARDNWFRLLDEVAAGAIVRIDHGDAVVLLQREEEARAGVQFDYSSVLRIPGEEDASGWGWDWTSRGLAPTVRPPEGLDP
jgi:hypothetical protein